MDAIDPSESFSHSRRETANAGVPSRTVSF